MGHELYSPHFWNKNSRNAKNSHKHQTAECLLVQRSVNLQGSVQFIYLLWGNRYESNVALLIFTRGTVCTLQTTEGVKTLQVFGPDLWLTCCLRKNLFALLHYTRLTMSQQKAFSSFCSSAKTKKTFSNRIEGKLNCCIPIYLYVCLNF